MANYNLSINFIFDLSFSEKSWADIRSWNPWRHRAHSACDRQQVAYPHFPIDLRPVGLCAARRNPSTTGSFPLCPIFHFRAAHRKWVHQPDLFGRKLCRVERFSTHFDFEDCEGRRGEPSKRKSTSYGLWEHFYGRQQCADLCWIDVESDAWIGW